MTGDRRYDRVWLKEPLRPLPGSFATLGGTRGEGSVLNISPEGLFFATPLLPESGTRGSVAFVGTDGETLEVHGEVRWNTRGVAYETSGFGMRIEHPCQAFDRLYLQAFTRAAGEGGELVAPDDTLPALRRTTD